MKITDTERMDWMEKTGNGMALIHDDAENWAIAYDGMQNISDKMPSDLCTSFFIKKKNFRPTIRKAIDLAIKRDIKESFVVSKKKGTTKKGK